MRYDLYKWDGLNALRLFRSEICLSELFRKFGFIPIKDKLRDLRHLEGVFLTPELYLIPAGKTPHLCPPLLPTQRITSAENFG